MRRPSMASKAGRWKGSSAPKLKLEMDDWLHLTQHTNPDRFGYLTKQGQVNSVSKKRRYFVLDGIFLIYYESEDPASVIGLIVLEGSSARVTGKDNGFVLTTCSGREINLVAESVQDRDGWVGDLQHASMQATRAKIGDLERQLATQVRQTTEVLRQKTDLEQANAALQKALARDITDAETQMAELAATISRAKAAIAGGAAPFLSTSPPEPPAGEGNGAAAVS